MEASGHLYTLATLRLAGKNCVDPRTCVNISKNRKVLALKGIEPQFHSRATRSIVTVHEYAQRDTQFE